jgi:2-hydroxy-6-oxonona-2,4-dienedioate hydrolase
VTIGRIAAFVVMAAAGLAGAFIGGDLWLSYRRIGRGSRVVASPLGDLEYRRGGAGPAVLVIHGSGGGCDQGELIAEAVLGDGFDWIAPSRFGYLRSALPPEATFDDQARAYGYLLDHLDIDRVAVVALSHGGPSALLFAALEPERVSSLTLLSCGVASAPGGAQAEADHKGDRLKAIFQYDLAYWGVSHLMRRQLIGLMGADEAVLAGLTPEKRKLVDQLIERMNPVAPRYAGVAFDNRAALPNERIAAIRAPTLILHAADDGLQLFRNAEFAAAMIPGARLRRFERGGHLLVAVELEEIRKETHSFVLANLGV